MAELFGKATGCVKGKGLRRTASRPPASAAAFHACGRRAQAEVQFDVGQRPARCRLRHMQPPRGLGHGAALHRGARKISICLGFMLGLHNSLFRLRMKLIDGHAFDSAGHRIAQ